MVMVAKASLNYFRYLEVMSENVGALTFKNYFECYFFYCFSFFTSSSLVEYSSPKAATLMTKFRIKNPLKHSNQIQGLPANKPIQKPMDLSVDKPTKAKYL